jgi:hypothetical protein
MSKSRLRMVRSRSARLAAASLGAGVLLFSTVAPSRAEAVGYGHWWRSSETDGDHYDVWKATWMPTAISMSNPSHASALRHLYFNIDQSFQENITDTNAAFEEVGDIRGYAIGGDVPISHRFYWASCQDPSDRKHCNNTQNPNNYFVGEMLPSPTLNESHNFEFKAAYGQHSDGTNWWDVFIRDATANGSFIRGGGRGSAASNCCSSAADWGTESEVEGGYFTSYNIPQTTVANLLYSPVGDSNAYSWIQSFSYFYGLGCNKWADDSVDKGFCGSGDPPPFTHSWVSKYKSITIGGGAS